MGMVGWYKKDRHGEKNGSLKVHMMGSICKAFHSKCQDKGQKGNLKPDDEGPALRCLQSLWSGDSVFLQVLSNLFLPLIMISWACPSTCA